MASTYLTRTPSSASNRRTCTVSLWVKQDNLTDNRVFFDQGVDGSNFIRFYLDSNNRLAFYIEDSSAGGTQALLKPSALLRDVSAWYHFVIAVDVTQATESNRVKMYINGELQTSFNDSNYPSQNLDIEGLNTTNPVNIGRRVSNNDNYFSGLISHYHFIDGTAYDASDFGSTDSVTGEWKINTSPSVTYGTNGFFILKDGNSVTDQSGEGNDFTVGGGTLTKTEDCPSNVFATFQPLDLQASTQTFAEGNLKVTTDSSGWDTIASTIGGTSGKWYFEAKLITLGNYAIIGVIDINDANLNTTSSYYIGASTPDNGYQNNGARPDTGGGFGASYTANDIIGIAIDMDNLKVYFSKNGTFQNSGNPTSGATGTGAQDLTASTTYCFAISGHGSTVWEANFGNGYFGTTAVSSAGTNVSGIGIFEYDVPTGYTALSTKGLNL